jgi:hypothetical protein
MKFANRQKGLGVGGWLILILLFGGALTIGMKLFPVYMDHNTMEGVLDGLAAEEGHSTKRLNDVQDLITKRFRLNNIRDFDFKNKMKIKREAEGVSVTLSYEERIPLVANVELLATFHKEVLLK